MKRVLNWPFHCKYVEALNDITNTSNAIYTINKCNQSKYITNSNENTLRIKIIIASFFISPFDTDFRYAPSLINIVSDTPYPDIVQDCLLSVKDAEKKLQN